MTKQQEQLLENKVRKIVKKVMTEATEIDSIELKSLTKYVNIIGSLPAMNRVSNNVDLIQIDKQINNLRHELMTYIEENSQYKFTASGPSSWKLVKK